MHHRRQGTATLTLALLPVLHAGDANAGAELGAWLAQEVALIALATSALAVAIPRARAAGERL
jgi:hypothetical protein